MKVEIGVTAAGLAEETLSWDATMIVGGRGAASWLRVQSGVEPTGGSTKRGLASLAEPTFRAIQHALGSLPDLWNGLLIEDHPYRYIACIDGAERIGCSRYELPAALAKALDPAFPASPEPAFLDIWRPCFAHVEATLLATGMPRELAERFR